MRVLHVISGLDLGGAETLLYRLTTRRSDEFSHEIVCLGDRGWYSAPLQEQGITVHHLCHRPGSSLLRTVFNLRRLLKDIRPDVIQSWLYVSNVLSGLIARPLGIPVVWGIHASTLEHVGRMSRACAYVGGFCSHWLADFVVNCSSRSAELHAKMGYDRVAGAVVHNGYDPSAFVPDESRRSATREALGVAPCDFVIGTVGRWHPQKDIPNLLSAVHLLGDRGVPVRCMLVGSGLSADNPELAGAIRESRCADRVTTLGSRADVPDVARALDVHVLASSGSEAFPNVIAETMLSGTPNVATDVGDAALMVGDTGWIVPPSDPESLAGAIGRALRERTEQPEAWERRRSAARQSIVERFTFDRMATAYEEIWTLVVRSAEEELAPSRTA